MPHEVKKKTIPHVNEAGGDPAKHAAAVRHTLEQAEAGHYGFGNFKQTDLGNGRTEISVERFETDPAAPAEPHGL